MASAESRERKGWYVGQLVVRLERVRSILNTLDKLYVRDRDPIETLDDVEMSEIREWADVICDTIGKEASEGWPEAVLKRAPVLTGGRFC